MFNSMYSDRSMAWGFSNPFGLGPTLAGKAGRGWGTILIPCNTQYMHLKQYKKGFFEGFSWRALWPSRSCVMKCIKIQTVATATIWSET